MYDLSKETTLHKPFLRERTFAHMILVVICLVPSLIFGENGPPPPEATLAYVTLDVDLSSLPAKQKRMIPHLMKAAKAMDAVFWKQAYGDRESLLAAHQSPNMQKLINIHYGPWDRYRNNAPFLQGVLEKPLGAQFYPDDVRKEAVEQEFGKNPALKSPYTLVRRDNQGRLIAIPYHEAFAEEHKRAATHLIAASAYANDPALKKYLTLRAKALLDDSYQQSDLAWMDLKESDLDIIIGPIESYEDQLLGIKTAHEAFVLVRDRDWSQKLKHYETLLPAWQKQLPVTDIYKSEVPGTDSDLGVYDVLFYAGDAYVTRAIAVNLPNDAQVQKEKGSRRLQLKNAMRSKFDLILKPMASALLVAEQSRRVNFSSFFFHTMLHEVAHGLGIHDTVNGRGKVDDALKENAWMLEEAKADIMGLFLLELMHQDHTISQVEFEDALMTAFASIFRTVRFGPSSSHARANLIYFNYFRSQGVFDRSSDGIYTVKPEAMAKAVESLLAIILRLQGDGDYEGLNQLEREYGVVGPELKNDLAYVEKASIPIDVVFQPYSGI